MKIGLLQVNPVVGDLEGNARRILAAARKAAVLGADLCLTPELALLGYPPRDLLLLQGLAEKCGQAARDLARDLRGLVPVLVGSIEANPGQGKPLFNSGLWLEQGEVKGSFHKTLLPSYDVFDEARYFEPGQGPGFLDLKGRVLAVTVCEDAWNDAGFWPRRNYRRDPLEEAAQRSPAVLLNLAASPFSLGKQALREALFSAAAKKHGAAFVSCNQVGGNDDLVFDGRSCAFSRSGELVARASAFAEDVLVLDPEAGPGTIRDDDFGRESETWRALILGLGDYFAKSSFSRAIVGLSGGVDSAVTAAVASQALGPKNVLGVLMPSPFSSPGSLDDSKVLAANLGIETLILPIRGVMNAFESALAEAFADRQRDVTEENIQARIRGVLLMALSNKLGGLVLTTGNKSELAVGYCTIYGDMAGGLAVISDLPKTAVYALARWINQKLGQTIPEAILKKPPSAELRPGQTDRDSLPAYEVLDEILRLHIEKGLGAEAIATAGFDPATARRVLAMVAAAEFKRRQAVPGIKIRERSFGTGWRMPLACKRPF
ncbi:MAG: NAD+ synthase [Desulfovibrionaceae bacterium]|nr:NAD+ synthase [Desulfovibrionaceae bacterium]